jgi:hypothetical protein
MGRKGIQKREKHSDESQTRENEVLFSVIGDQSISCLAIPSLERGFNEHIL